MDRRDALKRLFLGAAAVVAAPALAAARDHRVKVDGDGKNVVIRGNTFSEPVTVEGTPASLTLMDCHFDMHGVGPALSIGSA